jgi:hypothetical protein
MGMNTPPVSRHRSGTREGIVGNAANREFTEPGRQRIDPAVLGNAKRALESNAEAGAELTESVRRRGWYIGTSRSTIHRDLHPHPIGPL